MTPDSFQQGTKMAILRSAVRGGTGCTLSCVGGGKYLSFNHWRRQIRTGMKSSRPLSRRRPETKPSSEGQKECEGKMRARAAGNSTLLGMGNTRAGVLEGKVHAQMNESQSILRTFPHASHYLA